MRKKYGKTYLEHFHARRSYPISSYFSIFSSLLYFLITLPPYIAYMRMQITRWIDVSDLSSLTTEITFRLDAPSLSRPFHSWNSWTSVAVSDVNLASTLAPPKCSGDRQPRLSECINFSAFVLGLYATTTERNNQPCFFELYGPDSTSTVNGLINRLGSNTDTGFHFSLPLKLKVALTRYIKVRSFVGELQYDLFV